MRSVVSADWVLPVGAPPLRDGAVAIEDGRIAAVGPQSELGRGRRYEDAVIAPGLVNCHSHLEYAVYAGFGDGLADFSDWIGVHVERKRRLEPADVLDVARLGAAECLACGVTTVGDCSFTGAAASACAELGLRATVFLEVFGADPDAAIRRFGELRDRAEPALSERVRLGVSPHAPYTTSAAVYEACAELGLPTATHLSESESELAYLIEGGGPWRRLADMLVEPPRTTGPRLLERAVAVGLGTDSPASSPSFDMFEELRAAVALARARERRPDALGAREALELATIGSARTLGLDAEIGSLEPGKRADLVVVSLAGSPFLPWEDPEAALVLGGDADRVLATVVGGE